MPLQKHLVTLCLKQLSLPPFSVELQSGVVSVRTAAYLPPRAYL